MPATQSRQMNNDTMTDEELNAVIAEAQRRRWAAIKAPFEGYSRGDIIKFTYAGGSNPGQPRIAKFNKFVDLKEGPGMQAIHSNKPKKYYLQNISEHELADADEPASDVEDNSPGRGGVGSNNPKGFPRKVCPGVGHMTAQVHSPKVNTSRIFGMMTTAVARDPYE
eukprot:COSAG01_NODE_1876_length_8997_cov_11.629355_2_plen_166_part_00